MSNFKPAGNLNSYKFKQLRILIFNKISAIIYIESERKRG
nr:MAG TPA: hypothetical protein [Caudoviricetes sp.]